MAAEGLPLSAHGGEVGKGAATGEAEFLPARGLPPRRKPLAPATLTNRNGDWRIYRQPRAAMPLPGSGAPRTTGKEIRNVGFSAQKLVEVSCGWNPSDG